MSNLAAFVGTLRRPSIELCLASGAAPKRELEVADIADAARMMRLSAHGAI